MERLRVRHLKCLWHPRWPWNSGPTACFVFGYFKDLPCHLYCFKRKICGHPCVCSSFCKVFFFGSVKFFSITTFVCFQQFNYDVLYCSFPCVYCAWDSLSFLGLSYRFYNSHQIWKFVCYYRLLCLRRFHLHMYWNAQNCATTHGALFIF